MAQNWYSKFDKIEVSDSEDEEMEQPDEDMDEGNRSCADKEESLYAVHEAVHDVLELDKDLRVVVGTANGGSENGDKKLDDIVERGKLDTDRRPHLIAYHLAAWNALLWIRWKSDVEPPFCDTLYLAFPEQAGPDAKYIHEDNKDIFRADILTKVCQLAHLRQNTPLLTLAFRLLAPELALLFAKLSAEQLRGRRPNKTENTETPEQPLAPVLSAYASGFEALQSKLGNHDPAVLGALRQMGMLYEYLGNDQDQYLDQVELGQQSFGCAETHFQDWLERVNNTAQHGSSTGQAATGRDFIIDVKRRLADVNRKMHSKAKLVAAANMYRELGDTEAADQATQDAKDWNQYSENDGMASGAEKASNGRAAQVDTCSSEANTQTSERRALSEISSLADLTDGPSLPPGVKRTEKVIGPWAKPGVNGSCQEPTVPAESAPAALEIKADIGGSENPEVTEMKVDIQPSKNGSQLEAPQSPAEFMPPASVPTEREIRAAKAARIRLGLEAPDDNPTNVPPPTPATVPDGVEPSLAADVEYLPSDQLTPLDDAAGELQTLGSKLASINANWLGVTEALTTTRRLAVHHGQSLQPHLESLLPAITKSCDNPRSALCKSGLVCVADLLKQYGDALVDLVSRGTASLLLVLLKKSATDKRFVVDEARRTLLVLVDSFSASACVTLLLPHANHKSPKIRAEAAKVLCAGVEKLHNEEGEGAILQQWFVQLLEVAGKLVSDKEPDARKAARTMVSVLKACHSTSFEDETERLEQWEAMCNSKLKKTVAADVIRAAKAL